jgi:flagellar hook-length control protein FliK
MAAFRRQRTDAAPRVSADNSRPDTLAVTGAGSAAPVTGSTAPASALPTVSIQAQVGQASRDQAVGERIQWMVGQKIQGAQVKLSPANLGPMEIRVQVQNDQASIQFAAPHAMVREALEAALPRLRDMFEASGVELVDVDVSGQSFAEQKAAGEEGDGNHWGERTADANMSTELVLESEVASLENAGRLDLFA